MIADGVSHRKAFAVNTCVEDTDAHDEAHNDNNAQAEGRTLQTDDPRGS